MTRGLREAPPTRARWWSALEFGVVGPAARPLAVVGCALALLGSGCGTGSGAPADPSDASTTTAGSVSTGDRAVSTTVPRPESTLPLVEIDWADPGTRVSLGEGWVVAPCEGEAPILCVERDGEVAGLIEAIQFPLEASGPPRQLLEALSSDFVESMRVDRSAGCGDGYRIEEMPIEEAIVAGLEGIRFGYEGFLADGTRSELNVQHAAVDGSRAVVITAAGYAAGGCPGRDELPSFEPDDLESFAPHLAEVVAASSLPPYP